MFRNQYDTDVTVFSPQGRLHQVEYAAEAVNQGTVCLGLRNKTHVVLAALRRLPSELACHQKKLFKVDDHMGVATSGLTADGRSLVKYMRTEALNHKYVYGSQIQGSRMALDLADMHQRCTQSYVRRPYGVGLLIGVTDQKVIAIALTNHRVVNRRHQRAQDKHVRAAFKMLFGKVKPSHMHAR